MRKIFMTMICLAGLMAMSAQNILTNGDFELWSYGKPVGWTVGLHGTITSYVNLPVEVNFGTQTNVAHSGSAAVKLQSGDFTIPSVGYSFNLPGILQVGESEGFSIPLETIIALMQALQDTTGTGGLDPQNLPDLSSLVQLLSKGVPCTSTPTMVTLWAKYEPQENDAMMVVAMTKQGGMVTDYAYEVFSDLNPNEYEQLSVSFENPGASCDSIMIIVLSSTTLNSSSVLYVDDVKLYYSGVGIPTLGDFQGRVYPNPVLDVLYVDPESDAEYQWTLTDMTGKVLQSGEGRGKTVIRTASYTPGLYLLNMSGNGQSSTSKILIR
jgi:hypothetical protein